MILLGLVSLVCNINFIGVGKHWRKIDRIPIWIWALDVKRCLALHLWNNYLDLYRYDIKNLFVGGKAEKNRTTRTPYHPPKQVRRANFYNFYPMSMKFCMEVTFGGIQPKRNTWSVRPMFTPPPNTPKPPQIRNFGNCGPIWMKLGGEV